MKKLLYLLIISTAILILPSCLSSQDEDFDNWKEENIAYYNEMADKKDADGIPYFQRISPDWSPGSEILMRWHNDRSTTMGNLRPMYNSTTDVVYYVQLYNGTPLDSSYLRITPGDSIYRSRPSQNIEGFAIALTQMHIGDSCTVIIPYQSGYGYSGTSRVNPYSTLVYQIKLKDIPAYEIPMD